MIDECFFMLSRSEKRILAEEELWIMDLLIGNFLDSGEDMKSKKLISQLPKLQEDYINKYHRIYLPEKRDNDNYTEQRMAGFE